MAYIRKRKKSYSVVYRVNDADGTEHQKSEGYTTLKEAEKRKKEIEYKQSLGTFVVPKCTKVKELIKEYVRIYGHNEWGVATYDGNIGLINNYIIPTIGEVQLSEINNHFMEKYYTDLLRRTRSALPQAQEASVLLLPCMLPYPYTSLYSYLLVQELMY